MLTVIKSVWKIVNYRNDPKFSDRYACANSADPDQTAPEEQSDQGVQTVQTQIRLLLRSSLIRVCTVCHSACIVWTHYSMVEPHSSNFTVITTNFLGVRIFRKFTVLLNHFKLQYWHTFSNDSNHRKIQAICFLKTDSQLISPPHLPPISTIASLKFSTMRPS